MIKMRKVLPVVDIVLITAFGLSQLANSSFAQTAPIAQQPLAFDAAVVKSNKSGRYAASAKADPGRVAYGNVTLFNCILEAYNVLGYQVRGPSWLSSERYDIVATKPPGTSDEQVPVMLRALLSDRFGLKLHHQSQQMSVYGLVVAKNGPKLKVSDGTATGRVRVSRVGLTAQSSSMQGLAAMLMRWTDRIVVDETGLKNLYDFKLTLTSALDEPDADASGHEIFSVVQEQLGLKLRPEKKAIDVIVIDHAESVPTNN